MDRLSFAELVAAHGHVDLQSQLEVLPPYLQSQSSKPRSKNLLTQLKKLLEMIRFSHTIFALPFALLAALMAWVAPVGDAPEVKFNWFHLVGILICMIGARSAAMAFNRLVDRKIDALNPRTAKRHLPAGELSVASVTTFTIGSSLIYFLGMMLFLPNWLPLVLSVPVLLVLFGYSYTKRFTPLAHFWLGLALMLAPICAWVAIRGLVVMNNPADVTPAVLIGLAVLFWVAGFDMIYACQDFEYDKQKGLKSIPVMLGVSGALRLAAVCHAVMIGLLVALPLASKLIGPDLQLGVVYWIGVAAVAGLLIYEHSLVRPNDLDRVNLAFFNVNAVVSVGLFVVVAIDLLAI
ncbi:UbiA-like polyprenyltransferase [Mariniblastus fucicola]|nr:UbiA-like polyprenyltransferase [Mariniblastus fucicola]